MRTIPLEASATVTLDGSGNGTVIITPPVVEQWTVLTVSVATSTATKSPQFRLYLGQGANQSEQVDSTFSGSGNVSDALANRQIPPGLKIVGAWTAGDPNAIATMIVRGTKVVQ
jgi:hypothetical protein